MSKCHPTLQSSPAHITACSRFIPHSGSPWAQPCTGNIQLGSSQRQLELQQDTGHVLDNTLRKGKDGEVTSPGRELRLKYNWLLFHTSTPDDYSPDLLLKSWKEEWEKVFTHEFRFVSFKLQVYHLAMLSDHLFQYSQSSSSSRFCASCEAKDFQQCSQH